MLPALAVSSRAGVRAAERTALAAPRSLNEPIGWSVSSFRWISAPCSRSASRRISGVRTAMPAIRARAASISASSIISLTRVGWSQLYLGPDAPPRRLPQGEPGGGEILDSQAQRAKQRDLARLPATGGGPGQDLAELPPHVLLVDQPPFERRPEVARLLAQRLAAVGKQGGRGERLDRQLACARRAGADRVDVRAGGDPGMLEHGRARAGGGDDHVGTLDGVARAPPRRPPNREPPGPSRPAPPGRARGSGRRRARARSGARARAPADALGPARPPPAPPARGHPRAPARRWPRR